MNKFKLVALLSAGCLLQAQAFAGVATPYEVVVGSTYAAGALNRARYNSGSTEEIGCLISPPSAASTNSVYCAASTAATFGPGQGYYCYLNNAPLSWLSALSGMNAASWLYFYGDSAHHCLGLLVDQDSAFL